MEKQIYVIKHKILCNGEIVRIVDTSCYYTSLEDAQKERERLFGGYDDYFVSSLYPFDKAPFCPKSK